LSQCSPLNPLTATSISAFCWRITRHNSLAGLAALCPQWLIRDLLPLPPSGGIPREPTRSLSPPSSADAAGEQLRAGRCGAHRSPSRPRWSRAWKTATGDHYGSDWHLHPSEDGSYAGTIKTLSLNIKARFLPAEPSDNEKAPNLRVVAGNVEIGAAWQRTSKDNTVYHSVKLDDPSFPAPIYANLVAVDDGYALVWSR
jgi:uncharacterized protein (DUF736 family)